MKTYLESKPFLRPLLLSCILLLIVQTVLFAERAGAKVEKAFSNGELSLQKGHFDQALAHFENALKVIEAEGLAQTYLAEYHQLTGMTFAQRWDGNQALPQLKKAYEIRKKIFGETHYLTAETIDWMGVAFYYAEAFEKSRDYHNMALALKIEHYGQDHPKVAETLCNLAKLNYRQYRHDFLRHQNESLPWAEKALVIFQKHFGENHPLTARACLVVGEAWKNSFGPGSIIPSSTTSDFLAERAFYFHHKALAIQLKVLGDNHPETAYTYERLAHLNFFSISYTKHVSTPTLASIEYYEKALAISKSTFGFHHPLTGKILEGLGGIRLESYFPNWKLREEPTHDLINAEFATIQMAIAAMLPGFKYQKHYETPSWEYFQPSLQVAEFIHYKGFCYRTWYFIKSIFFGEHDIKLLYYALEACQSAIQAFDIIWEQTSGYEQRLSLLNICEEAFEDMTEILFLLYHETGEETYLHQAFEYAQKGRLRLMLERYPGKLSKEKTVIWDDLQKCSKALYQGTQNGKTVFNSQAQRNLQIKLFRLKNKWRTYPAGHKISNKPISIADIQQSLPDKETTIVHYSWFPRNRHMNVLLIQKDTIRAVNPFKVNGLPARIAALRQAIYTWFLADEPSEALYKEQSVRFTEFAHMLYLELVEPLGHLSKKLIIIPNNAMNFLPFEVLLNALPEDPTDFKSHSYLINKHQISYCPSVALLTNALKDNSKQKKKFLLAVAPDFPEPSNFRQLLPEEKRRQMGALNFNTSEVQAIQKLTEGQVFAGQQANLQNFLNNAQNYQILHLATHGKSDDAQGDYSFVAFSKMEKDSIWIQQLYASDLQQLQLDAEMVVLSACESGIGQFIGGEGVIGLPRGFLQAGCHSIISSLWNVNDKATAQLMEGFYSGLRENKTKDDALRTVKLNFIQQADTDVQAHPWYWAGFIPLGDMSSVNFPQETSETNVYQLLMLLGVIFMLFLSIVMVQKFKQSGS